MPKAKKTIQNYEILDILQQYQNQYTILLAKNISDRKQYVLKKLSLKQGNQSLYRALLNEAKILKLVKHENIVTCFRMFKTNSNLYIVYNYQSSNTLQEVLDVGPKVLTFAQKETVAKQLCLAISELHKNLVVHLNINPESIYLQKKFHITVREFMYSIEVPEEGERDLKVKIPKSQFVAPEVKRGIACPEGDIYSFGKVLQKLQFANCKKDPTSGDHKKRLKEFQTMIEGMTIKDRYQRWTITDVYQCIFSKLKKVKRLRSLSQNIGSSRMTSMSLRSSNPQINTKAMSQISLKILQQRAMSLMLIKLFKTISVTLQLNTQLTVILSTLLLKKSTKMLANLGKYLHYGKDDIEIDINYKEYNKYSKTSDYFKICQLVDKEISIQKKQFQAASQVIFNHNQNLLKRDQFYKEMREQTINSKFLGDCARQYLAYIVGKGSYLSDLSEEVLMDLVLISYIACSSTFQIFYKNSYSLNKVQMSDQEFYKKLKGMPKAVLTQTIKQNIEGGIKITQLKQTILSSTANSKAQSFVQNQMEQKVENEVKQTIQI